MRSAFFYVGENSGSSRRLFHDAGRRAPASYQLAASLKDEGLRWVAQYQLIQQSERSIILKAVPRVQPAEGDIAEMKRNVESVLGNSVSFDIEIVDRLDLEDRGKFRVYRSLVPNVTANV